MLTGSRQRLTACGHEPVTTNQRMELQAALEALDATAGEGAPLTIITDSQYVSKGATERLEGWKARGWRTGSGKPVANQDLWKALEARLEQRAGPVEWQWIRGHNGDPGNEAADALAYEGALGVSRFQTEAMGEAA